MEPTTRRQQSLYRPLRFLIAVGFMLAVSLAVAACQPVSPAGAPAPVETVVAEATAAPAEAPEPVGPAAGDPVNGQYIATVTGGCGCHFNSDLGGLAGGRKFEGPFGVVYAANLTADPETGIANVSDDNLVQMLRTGQSTGPDGTVRVIHPIMPYKTFSILSDQDVRDVVAYLRTLEPISNPIPERELAEEPKPWTPPAAPSAQSPTEPVARGGYLATLANCGGCHTPKNENGGPNLEMMLAGAAMPGDSGEVAANITPDEATGIGSWSVDEVAKFLLTGTYPDGTQVEGAMAQQIDRRFSKLTEDDAKAMATFLMSIPAVSNDPSAK